jgi:2-polyprenyl-3-methyl-5-hydroxy-6-metoxy-1,4-benzoquinol methylase
MADQGEKDLFKTLNGVCENGVVVGNMYDKYQSSNPIVKKIMKGFESSLTELVTQASPQAIYEIGCGEGYWVLRWNKQGYQVRGCDFSSQAIAMAKENASTYGVSTSIFEMRDIYELQSGYDNADLIICCEVLEHLNYPELALERLKQIVTKHLIVSVPKEPLWRILNMLRAKYLVNLGNTPGHLQHWSKRGFISLISKYFKIIEIRTPLPWTMLLCKAYA